MIGLIGSMLRARPAQAVTVLLLSIFATAAAVAGPASLRAVDAAIVDHEVNTADRTERVVTITGVSSGGNAPNEFESLALASVADLPGFEQVYANETSSMAFGAKLTRVVFRENVCDHVVLVQGRCVMGLFEVVLAEDVAAREGLHAGDAMPMREARYNAQLRIWEAVGPARYLTVTGIYRPRDTTEAYWGTISYFPVDADGVREGPLFINRRTLDLLGYDFRQLSMDAVAQPGAIRADDLAKLRSAVTELTDNVNEGAGLGSSSSQTELPRLLDRIDRSQQLAHELIPVAFVPLVALCWFVIFLAVGYGVFGRRYELGLVALRGVSRARRWWLAIGESLIVILAGAPLGYVLGYVAVRIVSSERLGETSGSAMTSETLPYAGVALLGALIAALLAQRRELMAPVVDLLRRVPRRLGAWRTALVEGVIVVLAVVAVAQLRSESGDLTGISLLVPGLVIAAIAVAAARALVPLAGLITRFALRRGLLGTALAAAQLARRPGSQRLFVLLTVAVGLLGFVVSAGDVSTRARADRAEIATGATGVVSIGPIDARRLLTVTRSVDPQGRWAMAVAEAPDRNGGGSPILAVDSPRLAAASAWRPEFGADPADLARKLRPAIPESFVLTGESLALEVENQAAVGDDPVRLTVQLAPTNGGAEFSVAVDPLERGRRIYQRRVGECSRGCRVVAIEIVGGQDSIAKVLLHELRQLAPEPAVVVTPTDFADANQWRALEGSRLDSNPEGGLVTVVDNGFGARNGIRAADAPDRLPMAASGTVPIDLHISGLDGLPVPATVASRPAMLPRLGRDGALVDMEYADRASAFSLPLQNPQVWLGPDAPADAAERLRKAGLPVQTVRYATDARADLDREGPALALWFHFVAAIFALVLAAGGIGLVAAVDRRRRAEDLGALRRQGLKRRHVRRAALWGQLVVVLGGLVVGPLAAFAAWWLAGEKMPVFVDSLISVTPPRWPEPGRLWLPWAVAAAVFLAAALVAAVDLRRAVARTGREL